MRCGPPTNRVGALSISPGCLGSLTDCGTTSQKDFAFPAPDLNLLGPGVITECAPSDYITQGGFPFRQFSSTDP
jgi:hypothetical protein